MRDTQTEVIVGRLFQMSGPQTEKALLPNWALVRLTMASFFVLYFLLLVRGVATGGISVYIPLKISLPYKFLLAVLFTCGTLTCFDFEIGIS